MSKDVPPEFRIYIQSDEDEKYYRSLGVTIYEGPRGGKYVDIREVHEKESENESRSFDDMTKLKDRADNILTKILTGHSKEVTDEEIKELSDIYYKLNKARKNRMANIASGDISNLVLKVEKFENSSLNGDQMKKIFLKDGSVLYAKPVSNINLEPHWLPFNNVIGSRLLKLFSRGSEFSEFVPNISVVKVGDEVFVAAEEVYGMMGGDIIYKKIRMPITENTIDFLVSSILVGLWDVNGRNFMTIPDRGLIIPFDLDFIGNLRENVFIGPVDSVAFMKAGGEINSEELLKKVISVYNKYNDSIEDIIDSIISEYVDELWDVGLDDYSFMDIKDNFMSHWRFIGKVIRDYENGDISAKDALLTIGSDGYEYGNMAEILKADKVPVRYRIYVNSWQAQRLRRNGVKVYRGPRGGLYVDSRDLKRRNISLEQEDEMKVVNFIVSGNVDLNEISEKLRNPAKYIAVRGELSKRIDFIYEKLIDYKLGNISEHEYKKVVFEAFDLSFVLNMSNKFRENNNLINDNFKVLDLKKAGIKGGVLNAGNMIILEAQDGSKVFAKRMADDFVDEVANSLVVPYLLKVLVGKEYSGFIPTGRIIKGKNHIYVGLSEIYGLTFDDIFVNDIRFSINDRLKKFLAAQYVMGLDDSMQNVFVDMKNGTVVQFDYDYAFLQKDKYGSNHFSDLINVVVNDENIAMDIKIMGVNLVVSNYSELKRTLDTVRKYVLFEVGSDNHDLFEGAISRAEKWIDTIYSLAKEDVVKAVDFIDGKL